MSSSKTLVLSVACLLALFVWNPTFSEAARRHPLAGADETTPSRSHYFSWINNTNEGSTEAQTLANLDFFQWMHDEYGMELDIYAFDAGVIDAPRYYGSITSDRFKENFPNGLDPIYEKAKSFGCRLGVWLGPDGFGDTPEEEKARTEMLVKLCPDLIVLNHRLNLGDGVPYVTTRLWGGEAYIDVWRANRSAATHNRACTVTLGIPPIGENGQPRRLLEDHGVCLSSELDYWEDDLFIQAFSRNLILGPELYGSPWFLRDDEYPKLARIYNLCRTYRDIIVACIGQHGRDGAYAALRIGDRPLGAPRRAVSYPANPWEHGNQRAGAGLSCFFPVTEDMIGKPIDAVVLQFESEDTRHEVELGRIAPQAWITAYPTPLEEKELVLQE